jgi:hypothetical protein
VESLGNVLTDHSSATGLTGRCLLHQETEFRNCMEKRENAIHIKDIIYNILYIYMYLIIVISLFHIIPSFGNKISLRHHLKAAEAWAPRHGRHRQELLHVATKNPRASFTAARVEYRWLRQNCRGYTGPDIGIWTRDHKINPQALHAMDEIEWNR